jgi:hypothetical protein
MDKMILFSYVPLLWGPPVEADPDKIQEILKEADSLLGTWACVWVGNKKKTTCLFLVDNAIEISSHLMAWSENEPEKWFNLEIDSNNDFYYAIALFPNVKKSIERHKIGFQLHTGYPVPDKTEYKIFAKPISFVSNGPSKIFKQIKKFIFKGIEIRFMDFSDFREISSDESNESYHKFLDKSSFRVGKFKPIKGDFTKNLLQERLENEIS